MTNSSQFRSDQDHDTSERERESSQTGQVWVDNFQSNCRTSILFRKTAAGNGEIHPEFLKMSIVKSVLIYGCGEGTVGASIAMALAGKAIHVFACWPSLSEMSQLEDIPNITTLKLNPVSPHC